MEEWHRMATRIRRSYVVSLCYLDFERLRRSVSSDGGMLEFCDSSTAGDCYDVEPGCTAGLVFGASDRLHDYRP